MKILLISDNVYDYLLNHVVQKHVQQGLSCEELSIASSLWKTLSDAKTVDFSKIGRADLEKIDSQGISLGLPDPECAGVSLRPVVPEAPGC